MSAAVRLLSCHPLLACPLPRRVRTHFTGARPGLTDAPRGECAHAHLAAVEQLGRLPRPAGYRVTFRAGIPPLRKPFGARGRNKKP